MARTKNAFSAEGGYCDYLKAWPAESILRWKSAKTKTSSARRKD